MHNSLLPRFPYDHCMTAQEIFYILGSITLALILLLLLVGIFFIISLQRKINRLHRLIKFTGSEIRAALREGKSYGRYVGASIGGSILGKILKILRP